MPQTWTTGHCLCTNTVFSQVQGHQNHSKHKQHLLQMQQETDNHVETREPPQKSHFFWPHMILHAIMLGLFSPSATWLAEGINIRQYHQGSTKKILPELQKMKAEMIITLLNFKLCSKVKAFVGHTLNKYLQWIRRGHTIRVKSGTIETNMRLLYAIYYQFITFSTNSPPKIVFFYNLV